MVYSILFRKRIAHPIVCQSEKINLTISTTESLMVAATIYAEVLHRGNHEAPKLFPPRNRKSRQSRNMLLENRGFKSCIRGLMFC